ASEADIGGGAGDRAKGADRDAVRRDPGLFGTCLSGQRIKHGYRAQQATKPLPKHPVLPYIFSSLTERSVNSKRLRMSTNTGPSRSASAPRPTKRANFR